MSKFELRITIDKKTKRVTILDGESGRQYYGNTVMLLAGGPPNDSTGTMRLMYGNTNVLADIMEEQVFDSAVEGQQTGDFTQHMGFHKLYLAILAGIFKALLNFIPIPFPKHPNQIAPEELLERWKKEEEEKEESWPRWNM